MNFKDRYFYETYIKNTLMLRINCHENTFASMLLQKEVKPIVNCAAIRLFFKELECHQLEFKKAMLRHKTTRRVDIQWGKIEFLVPSHTASFFCSQVKTFCFVKKFTQ